MAYFFIEDWIYANYFWANSRSASLFCGIGVSEYPCSLTSHSKLWGTRQSSDPNEWGLDTITGSGMLTEIRIYDYKLWGDMDIVWKKID